MERKMQEIESLSEAVSIIACRRLQLIRSNQYAHEVLGNAHRYLQTNLNLMVSEFRAEVSA